MKLYEITDIEHTITTSFKDRVVSDLLADETHKGELVDANIIIDEIKSKFPNIAKQVEFIIDEKSERIRIYFNESGVGAHIKVPPKLKQGLGQVLVLHEISHMLYTKDLLCDAITKYRNGPQAFTVLRVLEDIAIEKKLEADHPDTVEVFKTRASHILPIYKQHTPTKFAKQVDELFLFLRGYGKQFNGSTTALSAAHTYLRSTDKKEKVNAVLKITDEFMSIAAD